MRKRLIIEDEVKELYDFQKILLLNKGKLDPDDVEFHVSSDKDIEGRVEVTRNGLLFHFDDLEQFLKFFFPGSYDEEGSDGEWDAMNYDSMYYGNYDFYYNCQERAYDDWREGYTLNYFCDPAMRKLKTLVGLLDPSLVKFFKEKDGVMRIYDSESEIATLLDGFFKNLQDEADEIICNGKQVSLSGAASKLMEETFCNGLKPFGIENWGGRSGCFRTYFISWGNLIRFFMESGEFGDLVLDTMINYLEKSFKNHPPLYYEIEYEVWDNEVFENETCEKLQILMDEYIEKSNEERNPGYIDAVSKINKLGLFNGKPIPGDKYVYMKVINIDPETLRVKYQIGRGGWYKDVKYGSAPVDEVIAIATQPGLFDPEEFRVDPKRI
jgi:hypothetical protein